MSKELENDILRILLKKYNKISYDNGIAKVIFDSESEDIAKEISELLTPPSPTSATYLRDDYVLEKDLFQIEDKMDYIKWLEQKLITNSKSLTEDKVAVIDEKYYGKTISEWKEYASKYETKTPIQVSKYIIVLEEHIENIKLK